MSELPKPSTRLEQFLGVIAEQEGVVLPEGIISRVEQYLAYIIEHGSGGSSDHNELENRDAPDQHPIDSITGLKDIINAIKTASGILKGDGAGGVSTAIAGTDYMSAVDPKGSGTCAIGYNVTASSLYSHAEGDSTTASARAAHAEGENCNAGSTSSTKRAMHAEGYKTSALGSYSHAEGYNTRTDQNAEGSHAEGFNTKTYGRYSHSEGYKTVAKSENQHVQGVFNVEDTDGLYADIVGNGDINNVYGNKNIEATTWTGDKRLKGDAYVHCNDDSTGGSKLMTEAITDAGGYFTGTTVEAALQEIGAKLASFPTEVWNGGSY